MKPALMNALQHNEYTVIVEGRLEYISPDKKMLLKACRIKGTRSHSAIYGTEHHIWINPNAFNGRRGPQIDIPSRVVITGRPRVFKKRNGEQSVRLEDVEILKIVRGGDKREKVSIRNRN